MIPLINITVSLEDKNGYPDELDYPKYFVMKLNGYVFRMKQTLDWPKDQFDRVVASSLDNWARLKEHKYIKHNGSFNYQIIKECEELQDCIEEAYYYILKNEVKANINEMLEERASRTTIHPVYITPKGYLVLPSRKIFAAIFKITVKQVAEAEKSAKEVLVYKDGWVRQER